jgi:hypothetical protein
MFRSYVEVNHCMKRIKSVSNLIKPRKITKNVRTICVAKVLIVIEYFPSAVLTVPSEAGLLAKQLSSRT